MSYIWPIWPKKCHEVCEVDLFDLQGLRGCQLTCTISPTATELVTVLFSVFSFFDRDLLRNRGPTSDSSSGDIYSSCDFGRLVALLQLLSIVVIAQYFICCCHCWDCLSWCRDCLRWSWDCFKLELRLFELELISEKLVVWSCCRIGFESFEFLRIPFKK